MSVLECFDRKRLDYIRDYACRKFNIRDPDFVLTEGVVDRILIENGYTNPSSMNEEDKYYAMGDCGLLDNYESPEPKHNDDSESIETLGKDLYGLIYEMADLYDGIDFGECTPDRIDEFERALFAELGKCPSYKPEYTKELYGYFRDYTYGRFDLSLMKRFTYHVVVSYLFERQDNPDKEFDIMDLYHGYLDDKISFFREYKAKHFQEYQARRQQQALEAKKIEEFNSEMRAESALREQATREYCESEPVLEKNPANKAIEDFVNSQEGIINVGSMTSSISQAVNNSSGKVDMANINNPVVATNSSGNTTAEGRNTESSQGSKENTKVVTANELFDSLRKGELPAGVTVHEAVTVVPMKEKRYVYTDVCYEDQDGKQHQIYLDEVLSADELAYYFCGDNDFKSIDPEDEGFFIGTTGPLGLLGLNAERLNKYMNMRSFENEDTLDNSSSEPELSELIGTTLVNKLAGAMVKEICETRRKKFGMPSLSVPVVAKSSGTESSKVEMSEVKTPPVDQSNTIPEKSTNDNVDNNSVLNNNNNNNNIINNNNNNNNNNNSIDESTSDDSYVIKHTLVVKEDGHVIAEHESVIDDDVIAFLEGVEKDAKERSLYNDNFTINPHETVEEFVTRCVDYEKSKFIQQFNQQAENSDVSEDSFEDEEDELDELNDLDKFATDGLETIDVTASVVENENVASNVDRLDTNEVVSVDNSKSTENINVNNDHQSQCVEVNETDNKVSEIITGNDESLLSVEANGNNIEVKPEIIETDKVNNISNENSESNEEVKPEIIETAEVSNSVGSNNTNTLNILEYRQSLFLSLLGTLDENERSKLTRDHVSEIADNLGVKSNEAIDKMLESFPEKIESAVDTNQQITVNENIENNVSVNVETSLTVDTTSNDKVSEVINSDGIDSNVLEANNFKQDSVLTFDIPNNSINGASSILGIHNKTFDDKSVDLFRIRDSIVFDDVMPPVIKAVKLASDIETQLPVRCRGSPITSFSLLR